MAEQATFRISLAGFDLMMNIVLDKLIVLGVQLWLFFPSFSKRAAVGEFHESLKGDADSLAAIVTGYAGFVRYTGIDKVVDHDLGLTGRLDRVDHRMARFIPLHGFITAFIKPCIIIWDMTGGTTHPTKIPPFFAALDPIMAAEAVGAKVCIDCIPWFLFQRVHVRFGDSE